LVENPEGWPKKKLGLKKNIIKKREKEKKEKKNNQGCVIKVLSQNPNNKRI